MCGERGSTIIVTTRSRKVAKVTSRLSPYVLKGLSFDESLSLFTKVIFQGQEPETYSGNLPQIKREIVGKCAGVPLAIMTIGRLLWSKNPETEWLPFMENGFSKISQDESDILPSLQLSYNKLSPHLKHCFAYCSLFPKGHELDVETLVQLWIAQGFVKLSNTSQCLEKLGLECFTDLLWMSFFQEVEYDGLGRIVSCKMHDLMHDLATLVAGSESTISNPNADNVGEKTRHVSFDFNIDGSWQVPSHFYNASSLRTFLLPIQSSRDLQKALPKSEWETIFSKFRRLRVFDLSETLIEEVPDSIKELKHLRYLDFSGSRISVLPSSISRLQNLQVLKLRNCSRLKELPIGITKLLNLRNLDCYDCHRLTHMPRGIGKLTSLQTLTYFVVAENNSIQQKVGGFDELKRLNGLTGSLAIERLHFLRNPKLECEAANLKEKLHLQSLSLRWDTSFDGNRSEIDNQELSLESLRPHPNIKELNIGFYGGLNFPAWFSSLTSLVDLSFSYCHKCKHLPQLSLIPSLKYLRIIELTELEYIDGNDDNSLRGAIGQGGEGRSIFFPSLKSLVIERCPKLMGWWKQDDDDDDAVVESTTVLLYFSCLSTLEISSCPLLTWLPRIPFLEETLSLSNVTSNLLTWIELGCLKCLKLQHIDELSLLDWLEKPHSLKDLQIRDCPLLIEKCGNNKSEGWPIIERIPNIEIDGRRIQWEGRYLLDDGGLADHCS